MRRLKFRRIANSLPNEPRRHRQAVIRWIYIAGVVGLAAMLGDIFVGSLFYLRSEGLVVGDLAVIAAEFPVTIRDIRVHQGDRVHTGDIAATVSSQSVTEAIARLTGELASREMRLSELRIRGETVDAIVGFAETRHLIAANARKELETLMGRGLLPIDKRTAAVETEYRSEQDLSSLRAEKRVIEDEMGSLAEVLGEARTAIGELRRLYDQGRMRVPIDGIVGRVAAEQGAVVRAGEPLFEIYGEQRYVLGYLPTGCTRSSRVTESRSRPVCIQPKVSWRGWSRSPRRCRANSNVLSPRSSENRSSGSSSPKEQPRYRSLPR